MLASVTYMNSLHKAPEIQQGAKAASAGGLAKQSAPVKQNSDTVTISSQAKALLVNSKTYSPTEESVEPSYEKSAEARLGQR